MLDLIETSEGKDAPATAAPGKQVKIVGDTSIMATLRTFGEGGNLLEITDEASGHGMVRTTLSTTCCPVNTAAPVRCSAPTLRRGITCV